MEIHGRKNQIEISELDPFLAELLRQIPASANTEGTAAAEQRIFSPPVNGKETELCAEWKMYVEPELRRLFQTATQTVGADLEATKWKRKKSRKPHSAHSHQTCRRMVVRAESSPARHRCKKQFHRARTERPPSLTDWIPPGPELVPGKLLRLSAGIYPPRAGLLRGERAAIRIASWPLPWP